MFESKEASRLNPRGSSINRRSSPYPVRRALRNGKQYSPPNLYEFKKDGDENDKSVRTCFLFSGSDKISLSELEATDQEISNQNQSGGHGKEAAASGPHIDIDSISEEVHFTDDVPKTSTATEIEIKVATEEKNQLKRKCVHDDFEGASAGDEKSIARSKVLKTAIDHANSTSEKDLVLLVNSSTSVTESYICEKCEKMETAAKVSSIKPLLPQGIPDLSLRLQREPTDLHNESVPNIRPEDVTETSMDPEVAAVHPGADTFNPYIQIVKCAVAGLDSVLLSGTQEMKEDVAKAPPKSVGLTKSTLEKVESAKPSTSKGRLGKSQLGLGPGIETRVKDLDHFYKSRSTAPCQDPATISLSLENKKPAQNIRKDMVNLIEIIDLPDDDDHELMEIDKGKEGDAYDRNKVKTDLQENQKQAPGANTNLDRHDGTSKERNVEEMTEAVITSDPSKSQNQHPGEEITTKNEQSSFSAELHKVGPATDGIENKPELSLMRRWIFENSEKVARKSLEIVHLKKVEEMITRNWFMLPASCSVNVKNELTRSLQQTEADLLKELTSAAFNVIGIILTDE